MLFFLSPCKREQKLKFMIQFDALARVANTAVCDSDNYLTIFDHLAVIVLK